MNSSNLPNYVEELHTFEFTTKSDILRLNYISFFIGVMNKGTVPVKVYFSESTVDSWVIVNPSSYGEFSVSTNYIRFEYVGTGTYDVIFETFTFASDDLLAPRFPNLYIQDINNNYVLYNPLNTDGFFTETYAYGDSLAVNRPYNSESLLEVDYWFNGTKLASTDGNFSTDLFNTLISSFITSIFPTSDENDVLKPLPGGQISEIQARIKNFWESLDRPLNDEYVGGWAQISEFNRKISLLSFNLSSGDKLGFPFTILGYNITNLSSTNTATVKIYKDSITFTTININASDIYVASLQEAVAFEVVSGDIKLEFTGNVVKMIDFAPIINIFYPIGFSESSGIPNDAFTLFQNYLTEFENNLTNARFTGRVFKYKWVQHVPETREVWDADYWEIKYVPQNLPLPYNSLQIYLPAFYMYSNIEDKIIARVWDENYAVLGEYGKPKNVENIINNDNIITVLGNDFSVYPAGTQRKQAKKEFFDKYLMEIYLGNNAGTWN